MKIHTSNREIRATALSALRGHWGVAASLALFYILFSGVSSLLSLSLELSVPLLIAVSLVLTLIEAFLDLGFRLGMLRYSREDYPTVGCLFDASKHYLKALWFYLPLSGLNLALNFFMSQLTAFALSNGTVLVLYLCQTVLIVLMVAFALLHSGLMPMIYLLADRPELSAGKLYATAWQLMKGNKWKFISLQLSFIGWLLLGAFFFFGIGLFFAMPYLYVAECVFYRLLTADFEKPEEDSSTL